MTKVLSSISRDSPAATLSANTGDTFAFTGTPTLTGSGGAQRYDFRWMVNPGSGYVPIDGTTGLSTADTNPLVNTNSQTANSITVTCSTAGSYTIRMEGAPTSGGSYTVLSPTASITVTSAAVTHATTVALAGPGSTVSGSAVHNVPHGTTGALTGQGSTVAGSAALTRSHATSGTLAGASSSVSGSSTRVSGSVSHGTSGSLIGPAATLSSDARRFREMLFTGSLAGAGAIVSGSANRTAAPVSHDASGGLVGVSSAMSGLAFVGAAPPDAKATVLFLL